jgi:enoyl-CoA hydratase/carnithine racemase
MILSIWNISSWLFITNIMRIHIKKNTAAYWQVTLDNPPINLFDQEMSDELQALVADLENDDEVKVVVFDSADPEYFMSHVDLIKTGEFDLEPKATGLASFPDFLRRLEQAPFVTIGVLRGRARGVGSEFLLGLDLRFAGREKAILSQIEVGCGVIPGAGGLERLCKLVGRAKALEIILGADDFDADTAAAFGWVNRSIPDAELDTFVERLVARLSNFERKTIALAKQTINERAGLVAVEDLNATEKKFFETLTWSETQEQVKSLFERGLQQRGDLELRLGELIGTSSGKTTTHRSVE